MQRKFQVFISSTYNDLVEERQDILKVVLDLGHIPSGMEGFYATDEEQLDYIKRIIDQCDYYVLVIAGRYGSVDDEGVSYTEREYDYAINKGLTVLAFINNDIASLPSAKVDSDSRMQTKLNEFRKKVSSKRLVSFWSGRENLKSGVIISLSKAMADSPRTGWVRGNMAANEDVLNQLNDFRNQVDLLRLENTQLKSQLEPQIDNLAPMTDEVTIPFTHWDASHRYKFKSELKMDWQTIFRVIGPSISTAQHISRIGDRLLDHIKEVDYEGARAIDIPSSLLEVIRFQLSAHGLIKLFPMKMVAGGNTSECVSITEKGQRVLLELITVKNESID